MSTERVLATGKGMASGALSGATIGALAGPPGIAIGAVAGGLLGGAAGFFGQPKADKQAYSLAMGPGNPMAGYTEGELGKDYSFTEYTKAGEVSGLGQGLAIADMALQAGAAVAGGIQSAKGVAGAGKYADTVQGIPKGTNMFSTRSKLGIPIQVGTIPPIGEQPKSSLMTIPKGYSFDTRFIESNPLSRNK